jgi:hypothetical protein
MKPWKVKKIGGKSAQSMYHQPKTIHLLNIVPHGKFWWENSNYDIKWGAHTLGTFSQIFLFTFRLLDFRFLCPGSVLETD